MKRIINIPDEQYHLIKNSDKNVIADFVSKECMMHAIRLSEEYEERPESESVTELKPVNPDIRGYTDNFKCDKCGEFIWTPYNYYIDYQFCPYCGKKVKGGKENG